MMSIACGCCATGNSNTTPCGPCNLPATGTGSFTATLTYRSNAGGTGTVTKTLTWFAPSSFWCAVNPNPTLGCVFTLTDYDTAVWLTDNANQPCTNFTTSSNHIFQVSCPGTGIMLIRHLVSCAAGTAGRTFTFTPSVYPLTSTTCSGSVGGTTLIYTRTDTSTNPDKTFTLNW